MKIIIPIYKNRISPVYDWCSTLLLVDLQAGQQRGRREIAAAEKNPGKQVQQLIALGAGTVVCGGISELLLSSMEAKHIRVISGISGDVEEVLAAMCAEELSHPRFLMPGCTGHRRNRGLRGSVEGKVGRYGYRNC